MQISYQIKSIHTGCVLGSFKTKKEAEEAAEYESCGYSCGADVTVRVFKVKQEIEHVSTFCAGRKEKKAP